MLLTKKGALACAVAAGIIALASSAMAAPYLVIDATSGKTLIEHDSTAPWYPASLTKLMTTYVALDAVRQGRLTMDTPLTMSWRAARMQPSKMGFEPGTLVTLKNALEMLMVKSPNDVAVMVAEGIDGSVEDFAAEMNATARKLGMTDSHFVNPNGLHDPQHWSSARDMAIVARALLEEFPDEAGLFNIGAIKLDDSVIANHNGLLGHYEGADGMKTGFTCASGFNVVASATRDGRKLVAVVLGAPTAHFRTLEAAQLLERGFGMPDDGRALADLPRSPQTAPPDMRPEICSRRNAAAILAEEEDLFGAQPAAPAPPPSNRRGASAPLPAAAPALASAQSLLTRGNPHFDPEPVYVGPAPGWNGPVLAARPMPGDPPLPSPTASAASGPSPGPLALQGADKAPKVAAKSQPKPHRRAAKSKHKAKAAASGD